MKPEIIIADCSGTPKPYDAEVEQRHLCSVKKVDTSVMVDISAMSSYDAY